MIKIQEKDFILDEEIENINKKHSNIGAVSSFIGYVRDINNNKEVISIELEVYEAMAYKSLKNISLKAQQTWNKTKRNIIIWNIYIFFLPRNNLLSKRQLLL